MIFSAQIKPKPILKLWLAVIAAAAAGLSTPALAVNYTWSGSGGDNNWSTGANWLGGSAPTSGTTTATIFTGSTRLGPVIDTATGTVGGLAFLAAANSFTISGTTLTIAASGTIVNSSTSAQVVANSGIVLLGSSTWNGAANSSLSVSAPISGVGSIVKTGAGLLALSGTNTYSGSTSVTAGVLSFGAGSLGTGTLTVNGGELRWASGNTTSTPRNITMGNNGATLNTNGNNVVETGTLSGGGLLTKKGEGVLTLSATGNSTSAGTTVLGGTLRLGVNGALASSKPLIISAITNSGTATMDLNGFNLTVSQLTFNGTTAATTASRNVNNLMTGSGTLTLAGNVFYWYGFGDETTDPQTSTITGNLALGSATRSFQVMHSEQVTGPELVVDAVVSGAGGINKIGFLNGLYGTMAFNAANTYTGTTVITAGMLSVKILANGGTASGIGASSNANSNLIIESGTLQYTGTGGSTDRLFTIGDASTSGIAGGIDASGSGAIAFTNTGTFSSFANRSATLILSGTNTGANTLAGAFIDNFFTANSLQKDGPGTWILTGSSTYAGGTTLNGGILGLGSAGAISGTGTITMNGGTLQYSASNTTDYSARFNTGTGQQYKIDTNGQAVTFASNLTSVGGSLTKYGAGTLTLSGSNSYNGGTVVKSGTLAAGNNSAVGTGAVVVEGGVFLVGAGVTITNGVTLSGGAYQRQFGAGASLIGAINATSSFAGDVHATSATLLAGTTSAATTLQSSFANTSSALNDGDRKSDIYTLSGVPVVNVGTGETDIFVLQLSFTSTEPGTYLAWLNTSTNTWVNAIEGNFGNNPAFTDTPFSGTFAEFQSIYGTDLSAYLGAWGIAQSGGTTSTWAVLNHNSDFAVIPEPQTWALVGLSFCALTYRLRRRA